MTEPRKIENSTLAIGCVGMLFVMLMTAVLVGGAVWLFLRSVPSPGPLPPGPPTPTPTPVPTPTSFSATVASSFKSEGCTSDEASILAAMYAQMAESLVYNGTQEERIQTANGLGKAFARLQRHRFLANTTPLSTRFPRTEVLISQEMSVRRLKDPGQLDDARRASAAAMFREVAEGLRTL